MFSVNGRVPVNLTIHTFTIMYTYIMGYRRTPEKTTRCRIAENNGNRVLIIKALNNEIKSTKK